MAVNVLVVDDEEGIRKSLSAYLKLEGYTVDTAPNGRAALDKMREAKFNIILMDINMPEMDGIEALKKVKAMDFSTQVIMMTAYSTFEKTLKSLEFGATDYILKPFDNLTEILRLVKLAEEKLERWRRNMNESILRQKEKSASAE